MDNENLKAEELTDETLDDVTGGLRCASRNVLCSDPTSALKDTAEALVNATSAAKVASATAVASEVSAASLL